MRRDNRAELEGMDIFALNPIGKIFLKLCHFISRIGMQQPHMNRLIASLCFCQFYQALERFLLGANAIQGVDLASLIQKQDRFNAEHRPQVTRRAANAPTFMQVFQSIHHKIHMQLLDDISGELGDLCQAAALLNCAGSS